MNGRGIMPISGRKNIFLFFQTFMNGSAAIQVNFSGNQELKQPLLLVAYPPSINLTRNAWI
jgi:hypothetical protein